MNPLQLGLRNLLGELLPGAVLLVVILVFFSIVFPTTQPFIVAALSNKTAVVAAAVLLASYILGSVIRLYAADNVDKISAALVRSKTDPFKGQSGTAQDHLDKLLDRTMDSDTSYTLTREEGRWAWASDTFPYAVWELIKIRFYHPPEMFKFFMEYQDCFAPHSRRGKEFFNYCKTVVYAANEGKRHALAEEVQIAEARVRFFAGTFWSLMISCALLVLTSAVSVFTNTGTTSLASLFAAVLVAITAWMIIANGRFRRMRLKEVDTVFDAFYIVHRHANECSHCSPESGPPLYVQRKQMLEDIYSGKISFGDLVALMKKRSAAYPELSSLYFAGADCDHPYFLVNDRVALGIAVLPENEFRSSIAKQHPHQNETIIVLDGELCLDIRSPDGERVRTELKTGDLTTIPPGQCHRILAKDNANAAFLFVKTSPATEPRAEICSLDAQFAAPV
jgi:mannose-6-phosphate isomerase-like protein (cupin superfamily)